MTSSDFSFSPLDARTTRRKLLGAAALASATPALSATSQASLIGDETVDIVIVGSGGAGISAALAARERITGPIVILEKLAVTGGNTRFSCGYFNAVDPERQKPQGINDAIERHIEHTMLSGRGHAKPELVRELCTRALDTLHWVESYGVHYDKACTQIYGGLFPRSHFPLLPKDTDSYVDILLEACRRRSIDVRTQCAVQSLTQDTDGTVTGVIYVDAQGHHRRMRAKRAVILASGGYAANANLCRLHDPRLEKLATTNTSGATGEMMLAAQRAGAYLVGCDYVECIPLHTHYARFAILVERCIFVDHSGRRFIREDERRDVLRDRILAMPEQHGYVIVDNDGFLDNPPSFQRQLHEGLKKQEVYAAQTLEEMAQLLRLPVNNFVETVKRYNTFVREKKDPDYHRQTESLRYTIEKPPFWASRASMSRHHTMGGVSIDTKARVLDWDDQPIPHLYAAGEVTGGLHGANRLGGNAICDVHVFGRIAGYEAAKEKPL